MNYLLPSFILLILIYSGINKKETYTAFSNGAKRGAITIFEIFPCLVAITVFIELFSISGLQGLLANALSPILSLLGVPKELFELVLLRPFSGSATTAVFSDLIIKYGADSYPVRAAAVIMGSSETVFYVTAVYFSGMKFKKLGAVIPISLICAVLSAIGACALCKIM